MRLRVPSWVRQLRHNVGSNRRLHTNFPGKHHDAGAHREARQRVAILLGQRLMLDPQVGELVEELHVLLQLGVGGLRLFLVLLCVNMRAGALFHRGSIIYK